MARRYCLALDLKDDPGLIAVRDRTRLHRRKPARTISTEVGETRPASASDQEVDVSVRIADAK